MISGLQPPGGMDKSVPQRCLWRRQPVAAARPIVRRDGVPYAIAGRIVEQWRSWPTGPGTLDT